MTRPPPRRPRPHPEPDGDTRRRLVEVAKELFADRGLEAVTIREVCSEAGANVAAVNYHFGDKLGLYAAVIQEAIERMREATAPGQLPPGGSAEERLRGYVRFQLERLLARAQGSWVSRLMNREMEHPTPELDRVVREAIRPRLQYLSGIVTELLGCPPGDPRVAVAVGCIHGQIMIFSRTPIAARLMPGWKAGPEAIEGLAEQVSRFALGGIRGLREG